MIILIMISLLTNLMKCSIIWFDCNLDRILDECSCSLFVIIQHSVQICHAMPCTGRSCFYINYLAWQWPGMVRTLMPIKTKLALITIFNFTCPSLFTTWLTDVQLRGWVAKAGCWGNSWDQNTAVQWWRGICQRCHPLICLATNINWTSLVSQLQ